ncbi:hypothetical protein CEXT_248571 [Caerostris extrusa]|uniref:Uncharacterized protein n=1 Tax=Caerostris extrusa TaxID=172846 RepID=A0AAV4SF73_CAEEX|nr:hypothetical protein CEXT_248571 [Caerostris extrusa]
MSSPLILGALLSHHRISTCCRPLSDPRIRLYHYALRNSSLLRYHAHRYGHSHPPFPSSRHVIGFTIFYLSIPHPSTQLRGDQSVPSTPALSYRFDICVGMSQTRARKPKWGRGMKPSTVTSTGK